MKSILLIDDDEDDREFFLEAFRGLNIITIHPITATNGEDGLQKLLKADILPSLIFLDLNMPLMDGLEFLGKVKTHSTLKNIPIVVLSTSSNPGTMQQTKELGAKDFITKPDQFSRWGKVIKKFISDL